MCVMFISKCEHSLAFSEKTSKIYLSGGDKYCKIGWYLPFNVSLRIKNKVQQVPATLKDATKYTI